MAGCPSPAETTSVGERTRARSPEPGGLRELMSVAVPLVLSSGSISLTIAIDRLFLTWYSTEALAASTPASGLYWAVVSALVGTVNYVNTFVAQYDGSRQPERIAAAVWQGIFVAIGGGALLIGLVPLAPLIFAWVAHEPPVQHLEVQFFSVLIYGAAPMLVSIAFSCFYSGRGQTRVVMLANFLLAAINIGLDPLLIFGVGPFPRLGIVGAALATDIAYVAVVGLYIVLSIHQSDFKSHRFWKYARWDGPLMARLLWHGTPTGLQLMAESSAFSIFLFLVGRLGTSELAATNLAFNINALSFVPMVGVGVAVMTLVGRRIGEGRPDLAVRTVWQAAAATSAYMLFFGVLFVTSPELILRPFTRTGAEAELAGIRDQVVVLLRFVAFYTFFDGIAIVFASAIRGAGDTRFPFVYTMLLAWSLLVLPTYAIVTSGHGGLYASWLACSAYVCLLGIGFWLRFLQGKWKAMRVIEPA